MLLKFLNASGQKKIESGFGYFLIELWLLPSDGPSPSHNRINWKIFFFGSFPKPELDWPLGMGQERLSMVKNYITSYTARSNPILDLITLHQFGCTQGIPMKFTKKFPRLQNVEQGWKRTDQRTKKIAPGT